ncbi:ATP-binding protein [Psychroflexus tropicus]|uniref:ATP-binding protein n=1 Tax=Psychroflexus tropicus TaxID=197345 RepID=UPI00037F3169|nr:ATP-binding protein [Psychroflexus tropicus]
MIADLKTTMLDSISFVFEKSKKCGLPPELFQELDSELTVIANYFHVSKPQAFFIALVFSMNYGGSRVDFGILSNYLDCDAIKILKYCSEFDQLYDKGILIKEKQSYRLKLARASDIYTINEKASEAILKGEPLPYLKKDSIDTVIQFLERMDHLSLGRNGDEQESKQLQELTEKMLKDYAHFPLVGKINAMELSSIDAYILMYLIWRTVKGYDQVLIDTALSKIMVSASDKIYYTERVMTGQNKLIKNSLVEVIKGPFQNMNELKLTEKADDLIEASGIKLFRNRESSKNILDPKDIASRQLIFNEDEMKQLSMLKDLLEDSKFKSIQNRLEQKNLSKGIVTLLHGTPGTGKTEIVKQMAKDTNRQLIKVDISASKSSWFGESERLIKQIFKNYTRQLDAAKRAPILFFNEADAILSKRKNNSSSNVAQTENAIQNIILEELENFEGILIATTNLVHNLDKAFERRFLFKVKFNKPTPRIRAKIWKSKFPNLSDTDCNYLAQHFMFTGGQIDNILRMSEIQEILHRKVPSLQNLLVFCSEESIVEAKTKIGFS